MNHHNSESGLTLLDWLICSYLALPLLIFCAWFKWPVAVALATLMIFAFGRLFGKAKLGHFEVQPATLLLISILALGWTALAGVGHLFYANTDWVTRDATMRDLTATAWPPAYAKAAEGDEFDLILRAPIGYYLPAALVGSLTSLQSGDIALFTWTAIGFVLFMSASTALFSSARQRVICCCLLIGFGGLDLVGYKLRTGAWPAIGQHIEPWSGFAQYSSNSTLLFWVPNHALPAWLGIVMVLRHWQKSELARLAPLFAAVVPLWSPLAAIGLAPFFIAGIDWRRDWRILASIKTALPFWAMALIVARFVTMDSHAIPGGWELSEFPSVTAFLGAYLPFCALEFGILALILIPLGAYDIPLGLSIAILLALPFFRFGIANDLVMRSSIPALTVLALATVRPLADAGRSAWRLALMAVLGVGAMGSAEEPLRALTQPRWGITGHTLPQAYRLTEGEVRFGLPAHYVANLNQPGLEVLMREPTLVRPYPLPAPERAP